MTGIQVAVWFRDGAPTLALKQYGRKKLQQVGESCAHPLEIHSLPAVDFAAGQTAEIKRQIEIAKQSFWLSGKRKSL